MTFEKRSRVVMILPAPKTFSAFLIIEHIIGELLDLTDGTGETLDIPHVVRGKWYNLRTNQIVYGIADSTQTVDFFY